MKSRSDNRAPGGKVTLPGQLDLPNTEQQVGATLRRKADASLCAPPRRWILRPDGTWQQPPAPVQQPCDHGLFSDQSTQVDLEDLL